MINIRFITNIFRHIGIDLCPKTKDIALMKYVNVDAGIFDSITYQIAIYNDLETAKNKSHFKTSIYEIPEYLLDKMNSILNSRKRQGMKLNDAWCAEKHLLDNKCKIVYINRNYF